jgi:hypothetical protein
MRPVKKQLRLPCFYDCNPTGSTLDGFPIRRATPAFGVVVQAAHILRNAIPASLATLALLLLLVIVAFALKVLNMNYPFCLLLVVWLFCDAVFNTNISIAGSSGYESLANAQPYVSTMPTPTSTCGPSSTVLLNHMDRMNAIVAKIFTFLRLRISLTVSHPLVGLELLMWMVLSPSMITTASLL